MLEERIASKIDASGDCWEWTGGRRPNGYGYIWMPEEKQIRQAHRMVYHALVGELPRMLDHMCHNRGCVNPDHLRPADEKLNAKNSGTGKYPRPKDFCKRGHAMTPENTYVWPNGKYRTCRTCHNKNAADYRNKNRLSSAYSSHRFG